MCTVAFLPSEDGGYLLGHNRDESRRRARGLPPRRGRRRGRLFLAPRDPDGGGTWLGVNETGLTVCVLNAAEREPSRLPAAPLSRGRIAWNLLHLDSADRIGERLEQARERLRKVRAFHLVVAVMGGRTASAAAVRFRWDGRRLRCEDFSVPALFVSSGFDQTRAARERGRRWQRYLAGPGARDEDRLAGFLASHDPSPGVHSVCMHGERARTVSSTIVRADPAGIRLLYHDGRPCDGSAPRHVRTLRIRR